MNLSALFPSLALPETHQYTAEVEDAVEVAGEGKPRRNAACATGPLAKCPSTATNLHENLISGVKKAGDAPFLGKRAIVDGVAKEFVWQTYNQIYTRVRNLGAGLANLGLAPDQMVGIFAANCPEWVITEHACFMYGLVTVPLYDTLGVEAVEYIIGATEATIIFVEFRNADLLIDTASIADSKIKSLKTIVLIDKINPEILKKALDAGINAILFVDLEKSGSDHPSTRPEVSGDTIATICYTSGTTGVPKGVLLSHTNLLAFVASAELYGYLKQITKFGRDDSYLSYLPLAHVFERILQATLTNVGARIGFFQGDTLKLMDDICELKPTIFASVPRLYNRIFDKIRAGLKTKGSTVEKLFERGYATKKMFMEKGYKTNLFWDKLVFSKIKGALGGNVRLMLSGAAPIAAEVIEFMRICFGCDFVEGYGQTETSGGASTGLIIDFTTGNVGVPTPSCMIKLRDVPAMNYTSKDLPCPRGEILIKGTNCFKGYYKMPEKTGMSFD